MAATNDLFFFGDDFDTVLEEEDELDEQFRGGADEVSIGFFLCHPQFSKRHHALAFIFFQLHRLSSGIIDAAFFVVTCVITKCLQLCVILYWQCNYLSGFIFSLSVHRTRLCSIFYD